MSLSRFSLASKGSTSDGTDRTSYSTGTYLPSARRLLLAFVDGWNGPVPTSVSGNGLNWSLVLNSGVASGDISAWVALTGENPTNTAFTANFSGGAQPAGVIDVLEIDGAYIRGTALDAVRQSKADSQGNLQTSCTVALPNKPLATSLCVAYFMHRNQQAASTPRTGWTEVNTNTLTAPSGRWDDQATTGAQAPEQTASASWAVADYNGGLHLEIRSAASRPALPRSARFHR